MRNIHMNRHIKYIRVKSKISVNKYRNKLHIMGLIVLGWETIVMYITFLMAYFHESKSVLVKVNAVNEANFEFVTLPIIIFIGLWAMYDICKKKYKEDTSES